MPGERGAADAAGGCPRRRDGGAASSRSWSCPGAVDRLADLVPALERCPANAQRAQDLPRPSGSIRLRYPPSVRPMPADARAETAARPWCPGGSLTTKMARTPCPSPTRTTRLWFYPAWLLAAAGRLGALACEGLVATMSIEASTSTPVIHDRIHPLGRARDPGLNVLQKVDPMRAAASWIRMREGFARRGTESPEDVALGAATVVDLLSRALSRSRPALHQGTTGVTFSAHRSHFVEADHTTARRRCGVERLNPPLFSAKAGSTRSPNQVSCLCQRKPSWSRISSMRLRCIAIPLCSCR